METVGLGDFQLGTGLVVALLSPTTTDSKAANLLQACVGLWQVTEGVAEEGEGVCRT